MPGGNLLMRPNASRWEVDVLIHLLLTPGRRHDTLQTNWHADTLKADIVNIFQWTHRAERGKLHSWILSHSSDYLIDLSEILMQLLSFYFTWFLRNTGQRRWLSSSWQQWEGLLNMITELAPADRCLGTGDWTGSRLLGLTRYFDMQRSLQITRGR